MEYGFNANNVYGFWAKQGTGFIGSAALASIIYNMDAFNVTDADLRTIDNAGREGQLSDAPMYASNHIFLDGSTQSINYPIPYTLGSNLGTNVISNGDIVITDLGGGIYNAVVTNLATGYLRFRHNLLSTRCMFDVTVTVNSGVCNVSDIQHAISDPSPFVFSGNFSIESQTISDNNYPVTPTIGDSFDIDIIFTLKEITNPDSFLAYFDTATKSHITVDNSSGTPSTTYTQEDSHSNTVTIAKAMTSEEIVSDTTYLDANPESIARLVDGETVAGLSFDLTDIEAFYPANEGLVAGATVYDVTDQTWATFTTITNYASTCRTNLDLTNYGASNRRYYRDATGRFTGISLYGEYHGDGSYDTIPTRTRTADITIEVTPRVVESILFIDTATGDITMNVGGSVTTSSGSVDIDTTTLQVGVKSIITVTGISISGESTIFSNFDGTLHNYKENVT